MRPGERSKVALVQAQQVRDAVSLGEHDERGVAQADVEIRVGIDDL